MARSASKSDVAFIDKIKTINIGTGAKPSSCSNPTITTDRHAKNCKCCGKPLVEMEAVGVILKPNHKKKEGKK
jgi:hypothetical protein